MTLPLFYTPRLADVESENSSDIKSYELLEDGIYLINSRELFQHAILSTRNNVGDKIMLSDSFDFAGIFEIINVDKQKKQFTVKLLEHLAFPKKKREFIAAVPTLKDKADILATDLLVQAGVDSVHLWQAERSISKWTPSKFSKIDSQLIASGEQSRRVDIPHMEVIIPVKPLYHYTKIDDDVTVLILHPSENSISIKEAAKKIKKSHAKTLVLVIGPEGGFTDKEITEFKESGAEIVSLGESIYRASFAGAAAVIELKTLLKI